MESIADNIKRVKDNIALAEAKAGRPAGSVKLIAVTKTLGAEKILPAIRAGITRIGENRIQELVEKQELFSGMERHLIGQLQSNKSKKAILMADFIHSVDRESLALALEHECAKIEKTAKVFIQVNVGEEPQKGGVSPRDVYQLFDKVVQLPHLEIQGLMTVPPAVGDETVRKYFSQLRELNTKLSASHPGASLGELSMGMSGDYMYAIEEGSTFVRIGTGIFGKRM